MSASDAAPLPRLGEVFFDVRGNSRSMRLSWYADTGIAVFSIWQGGRCTGTFRLPMDDLARMTEILHRGPDRRPGESRRGRESGPGGGEHQQDGYGEADYEGADRDGDYQVGFEDAGYQRAGYEAAGYDKPGREADRPDENWFDEGATRAVSRDGDSRRAGSRRPGGRRARDFEAEQATGEYGGGEYGAGEYGAGEYGAGEYGAGDHGGGEYASRGEANRRRADYADFAGHERAARYPDSVGHSRGAGYDDSSVSRGNADVTGRYEFPAPASRAEDGGYQRNAISYDESAGTDLAGYGHERFVPPYVQPGGESYANDNAELRPGRRRAATDPAYPLDQAGDSAAEYSAGRHGGQRPRSASASPPAGPGRTASGEATSEPDYWSRPAR